MSPSSSPRWVSLLALVASAAGHAAVMPSVQNGQYWCTPTNTCAFAAGTPGIGDIAVIQHEVLLDNQNSPAPPNPWATGRIDLTPTGSLEFRGAMTVGFEGGHWAGGLLRGGVNGGGFPRNVGLVEVPGQVGVLALEVTNVDTLRLRSGGRLDFNVGGPTSLINRSGGAVPAVIELEGNAAMTAVGTGRIVNEGIVRKIGPGVATLGGRWRNDGHAAPHPGTIEVAQGEFLLARVDGVDADFEAVPGRFELASGASFVIGDGAVVRLTPAAGASQPFVTTGSGAGHVRLVAGGTLLGQTTLPGDVAAAVIDFPPALFEWCGGRLAFGLIRNDGMVRLTCPGPKLLDGVTLVNPGVLAVDAGDLVVSGVLRTPAGGTVAVASGARIVGGSSPQVRLDGLLRKQPGPGTAALDGFTIQGTGRIAVPDGTLDHRADTGPFHGTIALGSDDALVDRGGATLYVNGFGGLEGIGRVRAALVDHRGILTVGAPVGALVIEGRLSQENQFGAPEVETRLAIAGLAPVSGHSQLRVTDNFRPRGTLRVRFIEPYAPSAGDAFDLIVVDGAIEAPVSTYTVTIEGLAPGFRHALVATPGGTVRLVALNHGVSLQDWVFGGEALGGFE